VFLQLPIAASASIFRFTFTNTLLQFFPSSKFEAPHHHQPIDESKIYPLVSKVFAHVSGMVLGRKGFSHAQGHEQLVRQLLLAKSDGAARHHQAFSTLDLTLSHLLHNSINTHTEKFSNKNACFIKSMIYAEIRFL
jgi:hypothetical protein